MAVRRWDAEEQVNLASTGPQGGPVLVALPSGGYVVTWLDGADPLRSVARFQVYDAAGQPSGPEGIVDTPHSLSNLSIAALAGGGFVIGAEASTSTWRDAMAYRFDASGTSLGSLELQPIGGPVSTDPVLAPLGTGFVALHARDGDLLATWYDASGALLGGEISANATTAGVQGHADLAALSQGGFVAAWTDLNLNRVQFRIFAGDGSLVTSDDIQVNTNSLLGSAGFPSVTALASGAFVVVWETNATLFPDSAPDIRARIFTPTGAAIGTDFAVNTSTLGAQIRPEVMALRGGGFVVAWVDLATGPCLRGQVFDAFGLRDGAEFTVNTGALPADMGTGDLSLAELSDGRIAVVWRGLDDDGSGIFRQILDPRDGVVTGTSAGEALWGSDAWGDEISGFAGHDTLWGLRGEDMLLGGDGNDILDGGRGDDLLYGNRGNDILTGGAGADDLFGGGGIDTASYAGTSAVTMALDGSLAGAGAALGDEFRDIEIVLGSEAGDRLRGGRLADTLQGQGGGDHLEGMDGNDLLDGGAGNDRLAGGGGSDRLYGGAGLDVASYAGATGVVLALDGSLTASGVATGDILTGIEGIEGSDASDHLRGDGFANPLKGGAGNDRLDGLAGNDSLAGGAGQDQLLGGTGADVLEGDGGNDTLFGGPGTDRLVGGTGADDFVFAALSDSAVGSTRDRVADFLRGTDDLVLTAIDANTALAGNQAFVLDTNNSFSRGEIRQVVTSAGLLVQLNVDSDAMVEMSVLLMGVRSALAAADFAL